MKEYTRKLPDKALDAIEAAQGLMDIGRAEPYACARLVAAELKSQGISQVYLDGNDEMMDILRLTCLEGGFAILDTPQGVALKASGQDFQIVQRDAQK